MAKARVEIERKTQHTKFQVKLYANAIIGQIKCNKIKYKIMKCTAVYV